MKESDDVVERLLAEQSQMKNLLDQSEDVVNRHSEFRGLSRLGGIEALSRSYIKYIEMVSYIERELGSLKANSDDVGIGKINELLDHIRRERLEK